MGLLTLVSSAVAAAPPILSGPYRVNALGTLKLSTIQQGGKWAVVGHYVSGPICAYGPTEQLLEAEFEGSVLVGALRTCLEGQSCPKEMEIPFLGVLSEGVVTSFISLPRGCQAPGLGTGPLVFTPTIEARIETSKALINVGDYEGAIAQLKRVSETEGKNNGEVLFVLGSAYNFAKRFSEGKAAFEAALKLLPVSNPLRVDALYNLACAESVLSSKDPALVTHALEHLKEAARLAPNADFRFHMASDVDLANISSKPDFLKLVRKGPK
jgi:tetratricopeptide (TPR) repeat protein